MHKFLLDPYNKLAIPKAEPMAISAFFETKQFCKDEDAVRVAKIEADLRRRTSQSGGRKTKSALRVATLLALLENGLATGKPYPTLASSQYMRQVRSNTIGALLDAVVHFADSDLRTVTVINRKWRFTARQLHKVTAAQIKQQFRTHLQRAGILDEPGFLVAFLHGEYEPTTGEFQLHFHILTTAEKAALFLSRLRGRWGYEKTATGAVPIKRCKIENRPKQFSYLLKSFWPERPVVTIDGVEKRVRANRRIKREFHTMYLQWLDRCGLADIMVLNNCVFRNEKFHGC
ncbi:hypothetical protein [Mesorhizobium sp. LNJC394B00]|uniref:hypothetical protein n=1 Tax=unclassified Mesorhizobium TaxID=325217 RepID=UPI0012EC689E|nr:hypothetical protein [Mesorhizobium sp. LNJC394B00]